MIKSTLGFLILLWGTLEITAQEKFMDQNGKVVFEASEALFEEVKATNTSATAIFDSQTNEIASLALVKGFRFKNALMEEHFNENYAESDSYPKAIFKGRLIDFDLTQMKSEQVEITLKGSLSFHGKEKEISTIAKVERMQDGLAINGHFVVTPTDFDIKIPKIVRNKIAKEVQIAFDFNLVKK